MQWDIFAYAWTEKYLTNGAGRVERKLVQEDRFWKGGFESFDVAKAEATRLTIRHGVPFHVMESRVNGGSNGDG